LAVLHLVPGGQVDELADAAEDRAEEGADPLRAAVLSAHHGPLDRQRPAVVVRRGRGGQADGSSQRVQQLRAVLGADLVETFGGIGRGIGQQREHMVDELILRLRAPLHLVEQPDGAVDPLPLPGRRVALQLFELCLHRLFLGVPWVEPLDRSLRGLKGFRKRLGGPVDSRHDEFPCTESRLEFRAIQVLPESAEELGVQPGRIVLVVAEAVRDEDGIGRARRVGAPFQLLERLGFLELAVGIELQPEEVEPVNGLHDR